MSRTYSVVISEAKLSHNRDQKILNPKIWTGEQMKGNVREAIMDMSEAFRKELGLSSKDIEQINIVGGNASYDYSEASDADIQLVVSPKADMTRKRFKALAKLTSLLNYQRHPKINGIDTNFFLVLRGLNNPPRNQSIYDITNHRWVQEPSEQEEVDGKLVAQKVQELTNQITSACEDDDLECHRALLGKLQKYRAKALHTAGEHSFGNAVYRQLSRTGVVTRLKNHISDLAQLVYQVQTEGVVPTRAFEPVMPTQAYELSFGDLESLTEQFQPSNYHLWDDCLGAAQYQYFQCPDLIQLSEALNQYYMANGRWRLNSESLGFIQVNTEQVRNLVYESVGQKMGREMARRSLERLSESSTSLSSKRVLKEVSRRGSREVVGYVLQECIRGETGRMAVTADQDQFQFVAEISESIFRETARKALNMQRVRNLCEIFATLED